MSDIGDFMKQQEKDSTERTFRMAMENARNAMRAVKIAIEKGDTDEALRLIDEARLQVHNATSERGRE